jgi:hypothetical protein
MEKLSGRAAEMTRQEWRELGVYYTSDDNAEEWHLHGSKSGLVRLAKTLVRFAGNPNQALSEHAHLGPHSYLTLTTWTEPRLDDRGIWGQPNDFDRLASILLDLLGSSSPGQTRCIREQFASSAQYTLVLHLESESFDPASLDPQLAG